MELKQLQYFVTVAEHLNFSRAAEALFISQPALSYQIAELERELGVALFTRDRRKVSLTPAGAVLLEYSQQTLSAASQIVTIAKQGFPENQNCGYLRIGFDDTEDHFECTGITQRIADFINDNSCINTEMTQKRFAECMDGVSSGELDVAFLVFRNHDNLPAQIEARQVREDRLMLVVQSETPPADCSEILEHYELLLVSDKPRGKSRILKSLSNLNLKPRISTVDSMPAGFTRMMTGKCAMVLPSNYYSQHQYPHTQAVAIPDAEAVVYHYLIWNKNAINPAIQVLLEYFS